MTGDTFRFRGALLGEAVFGGGVEDDVLAAGLGGGLDGVDSAGALIFIDKSLELAEPGVCASFVCSGISSVAAGVA